MDERINQFVRECGGWSGIGHVSDLTDENGRTVLLVSRPNNLVDIWQVLRGKWLPRVAQWYEAASPQV